MILAEAQKRKSLKSSLTISFWMDRRLYLIHRYWLALMVLTCPALP